MFSTLTYSHAPVHTATHMYRHSEMEPQQPYSTGSNGSNSSYFTGSRFSADADAASYSAHAENLYDEAGYNPSSPGGLGSCKFEDAEGVFRYDRIQGKTVNNYASPQLLCPRPTLPSSQFAPQFSWSADWRSEAPINVYQAYSEPGRQQHTSPISHPRHDTAFGQPELAQTATLYSLGNQQAFVSTSRDFAETVPNPIPTPGHHGDVQQPYLAPMPSFERGPTEPTHSTNIQPKYYAAHQPIPPEQRSSYSELAPNLSFMNSQAKSLVRLETVCTQDQHISKGITGDVVTRSTTPSTDVKKNPFALGLKGPPLTSIGRKIPPLPPLPPPSDDTVVKTPAPSSTTTKGKSRSTNEPRRPSLACTFCRERKIACGRPPSGSPDPTCNQCARRSFRCKYIDLKSTQLARLRASSKNPSSPPKRK